MSCPASASILDPFAELTDPRRREGTCPLINFVAIAIFVVRVAGRNSSQEDNPRPECRSIHKKVRASWPQLTVAPTIPAG